MREVQLTQGYVALVDDKDYERVSQCKWHARVKRRKNGTVRIVHAARTTYPWSRAQSRVMGKTQRSKVEWLHKFILEEISEIDHKDGDGLHNWRSNLRVATAAQNRHNSPTPITNTSGVKGVSWNKRQKRWGARIQNKHLGWFVEKSEATKARAVAEQKVYGEFARKESTCHTTS